MRAALSQVAILVAGVVAYELARLVLSPDWPVALANAHRVASWERDTHLAWEAPLQRWLVARPPLVDAANVFYLGANFLGTTVFFVWLYRRSRVGFRRFRDGFLLATAVALLVAWRFPLAPPRLAGLGLEDTLRRFSGIDIGSPGSGGLTDPVAAMPSLHAGWAAGVAAGLVLYGRRPIVRALAPLYPLAAVVTILATGNHFAVDALAGVALVLASLGLTALASGGTVVRWHLRRGVEQPGSSPGS